MIDPYAFEPERDPRLIVHSEKPFNAEPPMELLADSFLTPNELFYVRNHYPVPLIDEHGYALEIDVPGRLPVRYSLDDLKRHFEPHSVVSVVQCGGNRRQTLDDVRKVKGGMWLGAAMGNARWTGALLSDVLADAGAPASARAALRHNLRHVHFVGLDTDEKGSGYEVSVPTRIALNDQTPTVLAYEMNGEELPRDHGYPLRVVVPGVVGARLVKWLGAVRLREDENQSHWQQRDYKSFSPSADWDKLDWSAAPAMQSMPVQSAVCWPRRDTLVTAEHMPDGSRVVRNVRGYAYSGGGAAVARVDVSADNAKTWHTATLEPIDTPVGERSTFGWRRWRCDVPLSADDADTVQLRVKATDENYNTQPRDACEIWNYRGLACNAQDTVAFKIKQ